MTPPVTEMLLVVGPIEPATKRGLSAVLNLAACLARESRGDAVELARVRLEAVLGEHDGTRLEARGLDNVGAHFEKAVVHPANQLGPRADDVLVASFVLSAAVVRGAQIFAEHEGAECAVQNEDSFGEQLLEELDPVRIGGHCWMPVKVRAVTN